LFTIGYKRLTEGGHEVFGGFLDEGRLFDEGRLLNDMRLFDGGFFG
jgi:hypothetical protein